MLWGNWSGSEGSVEWWDIEKEGNESELEEETEVTHAVDHTLLIEGEISGFGGDETGSLDSDDGYEVAGLSILKSLGGVADWVLLGDVRGSTDGVIGSESAASPGVVIGEWSSVEESDIDLGVSLVVPSESSKLGELDNLLVSINWVLVLIQPIWISALVNWVFHVVVGINLSPCGHQVRVPEEWGFVNLVSITFCWQDGLGGGHLPNSDWSDTIVIENKEVGVHTGSSLNHTDLEITERNELCVYEMVSLRISRLPFHDIELWVFIGKRDSWNHIASKIDTEDEHSGQGEWYLEDDEEDERGDLWNVGLKGVSNGFLQVIENESTFLNTVDDGAEVVIKQNHISSIFSNIRAGSHGNTDIGFLDSWGIVDTITSDGDDMTGLLTGINNKQFLGRSGSGKHDLFLGNPINEISTFFWV